MKCVKPFVSGAVAFGCGQCMPCRFNKRREWTHRIMLETLDHAESCFVTLTYRDEVGEVCPKALQDWFKRFRKNIYPRKIRYFAVGEYGDRTGRPHYHAAVFGWPSCFGRSGIGGCECPACSVVRKTWGYGHVMVGRLEMKSAQYIAGYVTKKMTQRSDIRLGGRHPEFARMSLRPGIGVNAMWNVASEMMRYSLENRGDVPLALAHSGRNLPLGRHLRNKLRTFVGKDEGSPPEALERLSKAMSVVREFAWINDRSVSSVFAEANAPYAAKCAASLMRMTHEKV